MFGVALGSRAGRALGRAARALWAALALLTPAPGGAAAQAAPARPNILWIIADDMGPELGSYGGSYGGRLARTPHLDRLAREGVRYPNAFTTAPICSPSRSALATGMYQTTIGAHQHRTVPPVPLPPGVRPVTHLLREAGYFTTNVHAPGARVGGIAGAAGNGKTDYNFTADSLFDGSDWNQRRPGQPFFAQLTIFETHKGAGWPLARRVARERGELVDPRAVALPAYLPDDPVARDEVANYLDAVHLLDGYVGEVLARLEREGLARNTLVFFFADNGRPLVRSKQWLYDGGTHVPLVVRWPGVLPAAAVDDRLVSGIDIPAATLRAAGVALPANVQGRPFFGPDAAPREYVVAARDRADVATERMRSVRTARWKYIRNYYPMIPYMQVNPYMEREYPTWTLLTRLGAAGRLDATQRLFLAARKPVEELYDLAADPDEVRNLAGRPAQDSVLHALRGVLDRWVAETGDRGGEGEDPLAVFRAHFGRTDVGDVPNDRREVARRVYFGAPDAPNAPRAPNTPHAPGGAARAARPAPRAP